MQEGQDIRHPWQVRQLTLLLCAAVVAVTAIPALGAPPQRETIIIGMAQEPDLLGPFSIMTAAGVIENALWGYVAPFTDKWVRIPIMVDKLPTVKDGDWVILPNKKMKVTWKLRRGFTWHDGHPVTAFDWRFTYGMERNPLTPTISRFRLNKVDNLLIPNPNDPYTLVVQWNELWPFANSSPFGEQLVFPQHLLEAAYLKDPSKLVAHPYWRAPVGNGPYKFVEWVSGSHITVEASDKWPLGTPNVKRITFRFLLDATILQANQIAGTVDGTEVNNFGIDQMVEIERRNPQIKTYYTEALRWTRIDFNLDNEWLRDTRVRHALAYAIDREGMVQALFHGKQPIAHSWIAPRHPAYNPNVSKYPFDPTRAKALLAEAGFNPGPDGILRDRNGRRVELTFMTTAGNSVREQIQQIIKEQLKQVGVEVRIDNRPASVFIGTIVAKRQFPHLALYTSNFSLEETGFSRFHSRQIPSPENSWEGDNRPGWRNAESDRILEQISRELDETKRNALFRRHQELFAEELPSLSLYFELRLNTMRKTLKNVRPTGLASHHLPWNSWEWAWGEE